MQVVIIIYNITIRSAWNGRVNNQRRLCAFRLSNMFHHLWGMVKDFIRMDAMGFEVRLRYPRMLTVIEIIAMIY